MNEMILHIKKFYQEASGLLVRKNHDYAGDEDPLKNFHLAEYLGVTTTERAILVRMLDKVARIATVLNEGAEVKEETLHDTLVDLANYAAILDYALMRRERDES